MAWQGEKAEVDGMFRLGERKKTGQGLWEDS